MAYTHLVNLAQSTCNRVAFDSPFCSNRHSRDGWGNCLCSVGFIINATDRTVVNLLSITIAISLLSIATNSFLIANCLMRVAIRLFYIVISVHRDVISVHCVAVGLRYANLLYFSAHLLSCTIGLLSTDCHTADICGTGSNSIACLALVVLEGVEAESTQAEAGRMA